MGGGAWRERGRRPRGPELRCLASHQEEVTPSRSSRGQRQNLEEERAAIAFVCRDGPSRGCELARPGFPPAPGPRAGDKACRGGEGRGACLAEGCKGRRRVLVVMRGSLRRDLPITWLRARATGAGSTLGFWRGWPEARQHHGPRRGLWKTPGSSADVLTWRFCSHSCQGIEDGGGSGSVWHACVPPGAERRGQGPASGCGVRCGHFPRRGNGSGLSHVFRHCIHNRRL